jgi:spoIIIJ-associated protein
MKEAIGVGATPELALADACAQLGKESHEVEYELIEMAEKKLFGLFGGRPAKVRAYIPEEEIPVVEEVSVPEVTPVEEPAEAPAEEVPAAEEVAADTAEEAVAEEAPAAEKKHSDVNPADVAVDYLKKILKGLGAENLEVTVKEKEDGAELTLSGEDAHMVIGHHGETLSALTYLVGLVANHVQDGYYRITINTGNYREKREQTLQRLAKRMAEKALATGRKQSLEPMNPYERRIIHTAVQEVEGAISWSEGEDMSRHVVIGLAEGVRPTRPRSGNGNRRPDNRSSSRSNGNRGGNNRTGSSNGSRRDNRSGNGNRRPGSNGAARPQITDVVSTTTAPAEVRTVNKPATKPAAKTYNKESASVPLYGRIDVKK